MGLWHWWTGTQAADPRVARVSAITFRKALLELNRDGLAWAVASDPDDPEVLVATWKYDDARWRELLVAAEMSTSITIKMFLDDHRSTVRSVDQEIRIGVSVDNAGLTIGIGGFRGQRVEVGKNWTFGRKPDGRFGATSHTRFSTNDIKRALQGVARDGGWAWKGVPFARLKRR
jgi:hypothetical protein